MTTPLGKIKTGDPVILVDAKGLGKHGLRKNMKGFANSVVTLGDDGKFGFFMPDNMREVFVIEINRLVLDEERLKELKEL